MKHILFLMLLFSATVNAQFTTSWTLAIPERNLPTNAYVPVIASLSNAYQADFVIDLDASTYDNANDSTALRAICEAVDNIMDTLYIPDTFGIDTSLDVTGRIYIQEIVRQFDAFEPKEYSEQYQVATDIFRVRGRFKWIVN